MRAILDPSCICDKVTDDTAERLFAITRISVISNLHNFSIDSDAKTVRDMPVVHDTPKNSSWLFIAEGMNWKHLP